MNTKTSDDFVTLFAVGSRWRLYGQLVEVHSCGRGSVTFTEEPGTEDGIRPIDFHLADIFLLEGSLFATCDILEPMQLVRPEFCRAERGLFPRNVY